MIPLIVVVLVLTLVVTQTVSVSSVSQGLLRRQLQDNNNNNNDFCNADFEDQCNQCNFVCQQQQEQQEDEQQSRPGIYSCSLPGLTDFAPGGQYEGIRANYLSFATEISTPFFPHRAKEFEDCTGGHIVFSDAQNIFQDPVEDLGTTTTERGNEVYDGYFMSYSHFPEVSALQLAEPLNDRIRNDNERLRWADVLPKVKSMGEYRHSNGNKSLEMLLYDGDFFVPVIRLDLLEKYNLPLPNTWEEVVEYVKFFNGTDLNDDGIADDFGFCHFPRLGAGYWDWWWSEALYATWASVDQTRGTNEGFFFDPQTMEPRIDEGFQYAATIWKDLWNRGASSEAQYFLEGRCAIGFGPPGGWKKLFLTPNGIHRTDENGTVVWQPTLASTGEYAEPYRFRPFGSLKVVDRTTGQLTDCTPKLCPKAEPIPSRGHLSDDDTNDRASRVLPSSPLAGKLINRAPFYWSGGLGTVIRKSAPQQRKDLLWDFFVYTNSPATSVYDVANYGSWLDSWRLSQLVPGNNFREAGWSEDSYREHASVMQWALSKEVNGAFNIRLPSTARYTRDVVGQFTGQFIAGEITLAELLVKVQRGWNEITDEEGRLEQLAVYRSSLGLEQLTEVETCRLHRPLMDEKDPSICRKYDDDNDDDSITILLAVLIPVVVVFIALLVFVYVEGKRRRELDLVWKIDPDELVFSDPPQILGKGSFGFVLKGEYRGTEVAVKRFAGDTEFDLSVVAATKVPLAKTSSEGTDDFVQKSFGHMISKESEAAATLIDRNATTPMDMGQTMSAKQSRAMVEKVKAGGGGKSGDGGRKQQSNKRKKRGSSFVKRSSENNELKAEFVEELRTLATLRHQCVITIMGAVLVKGNSMLVLEYMDHGSLYDLLHNETMVMGGEIILPILRDIAQGIRFLHAATPQIIHCDLKSANILVDGRFRAKVSDFGLSTADPTKSGPVGTPYFLAPEILRGESGNTVESDAYAFGMVVYEVYSRKEPYAGENPVMVLSGIANKMINKRPPPPATAPPKARTIMSECLVSDPRWRPTFEELDLTLKRMDIASMEIVPQADPNAKPEQPQVSTYDMFPKDIADALRDGRKVEAQSRENCTIFSSEICGFDELAAKLTSMEMAELLHRLYSTFDELCHELDIYKIETVNNVFMAITGLTKDQQDHAKRIAEFSVRAVRAAKETLIDVKDPSKGCISIRAGFASGNVVANVVGTQHPRYSLFGNAVTIATRMEQSSEANAVQCSEKSAILLREQAPNLSLTPRGLMRIKGRGDMFTFFVDQQEDVEAAEATTLGADPEPVLSRPKPLSLMGKSS